MGRGAALDDRTVEAVGAMTEALETVEVARGHLFAFHQLTGAADIKLERAIELLDKAGHQRLAEKLSHELLGRNVLPGRWTFQVIVRCRRVEEVVIDVRAFLVDS